MSIRILTKNGVDNTNIDGARDNNFNSGRRSGIVKGGLKEGNLYGTGNTLVLESCELRLCGHRVIIDSAESRQFYDNPTSPYRQSFIGQIQVDKDKNVSFDFIVQDTNTELIQDNLDIDGTGTYQLEIGRFTQLPNGNLEDVVRTADLITGGGYSSAGATINIGNVVTNTLDAGIEAEVDVEERYDEATNKTYTDFTFSVPRGDANTLSIGTVESGEVASATITGIGPNQTLNLVLQKGDKGEKGEKGEQGIQGEAGKDGEGIIDYTSKTSIRIWELEDGIYKIYGPINTNNITKIYYYGSTDNTKYFSISGTKYLFVTSEYEGSHKCFSIMLSPKGLATSVSGVGNIDNTVNYGYSTVSYGEYKYVSLALTDSSNLSDDDVESWKNKLGLYDWKFVTAGINDNLYNGSLSVGTHTYDLSSIIDDWSSTAQYEVVIHIEAYNADTSYVSTYTDLWSTYAGRCDQRFSSNGRQGGAIYTIPLNRYLYFGVSTNAVSAFMCNIVAYRRVK